MKRKILVVDDDENILEVLTFALEEDGYDVVAVSRGDCVNGETKGVHLIIMDVLLSGCDGRDVVRRLRQQKATKNIPIIMISAHLNTKDTALEAGANDFLAKPFDLDDLLKLTHKYIVN